MDQQRYEEEIDLLQLAKTLLKNWKWIAAATLICGVIAACISVFLITPLYQAKALMYVNNSEISLGNTKVSISASDLSAAQSLVDTYVVILRSRNTLNDVIEQTGVDYTYEQLLEMVSASSVNGTEIFQIVVTDADPEEAKLIANTIANLLPNKIASIIEGCSVRIVDSAVTPTKKSSPSNSKNTLIGLMVGFVASCGIIILLDLLDDVIHTEEDLTDNFDLPMLAAIPELLGSTSSNSYGYGYGDSDSNERRRNA
ncbi:MAG: hypothetical protein IJ091_08045 [Oscillospiraceae bacterium]|nr:hypothetical protein [Oscillospiraceae bacterium]